MLPRRTRLLCLVPVEVIKVDVDVDVDVDEASALSGAKRRTKKAQSKRVVVS